MLQNAYFLAKIGADTAENEQHFAENLPKIGNYPTGPELLLLGPGLRPGAPQALPLLPALLLGLGLGGCKCFPCLGGHCYKKLNDERSQPNTLIGACGYAVKQKSARKMLNLL